MTDEKFLRDGIKNAFGLSYVLAISLAFFPLIFVFISSSLFMYSLAMFLGCLTSGITASILFAFTWKTMFSPKIGDLNDTELIENISKFRKKTRPLIATLIMGVIIFIVSRILEFGNIIEDPYSYVIMAVGIFFTLFSIYTLSLGGSLKIALKEVHREVDIIELKK